MLKTKQADYFKSVFDNLNTLTYLWHFNNQLRCSQSVSAVVVLKNSFGIIIVNKKGIADHSIKKIFKARQFFLF